MIPPLALSRPGLFVTGTDTGVGKTAVAAAMARHLHRAGHRVGVCKPIASGCAETDSGLVSDDALSLRDAVGGAMSLDLINPLRYRRALAPAAAIDEGEPPIDWSCLAAALAELDHRSDLLILEGIGGLLVPLDRRSTLLDLAAAIGYPVLVVTRPALGTLNHTAMTCSHIRRAGLPLAGLVVNRLQSDDPLGVQRTNLDWLAIQNQTSILAAIPDDPSLAAVDRAVASIVWDRLLARPVRAVHPM
jgi:dethiobiotin synthetase